MAGVLLDASLFALVVSFQSGLPGRVHSYLQRNHTLWPCDDDEHGGAYETGALVAIAIRGNDLPMLDTLRALLLSSPYYRSMPLLQFRDSTYLAARCGQSDVLEWLHAWTDDELSTCDTSAAHVAALHGQRTALQWLLSHCGKCAGSLTTASAVLAAQRGHYMVVECLHDQRPELFVPLAVIVAAIETGRLDIVRFLHEKMATAQAGRHCKGLLDKAAGAGQLEVVEYLHTACSEHATTDAMDRAAANGYLDVVRFLHDHSSQGCTVYAMDQAAAQGHLDVVRFLHETREEGCTVYAMGGASRHGHLDIVKFLQENRAEGCSSWALAEAAEKGHFEVVQYLHTHRHGTQWEDSALFRAARNGHLRVVEYLCDHTRVGDRAFDARRAAKTAGKLEVVKVLDKQIKKLLDEKDLEQREKLRRRKHAKAKKKRK